MTRRPSSLFFSPGALVFSVLALVSGCHDRSEGCVNFNSCDTDDQCADNEVCDGFLGTSCRVDTVCDTNADCECGEVCELRAAPKGVTTTHSTCVSDGCVGPDDWCNHTGPKCSSQTTAATTGSGPSCVAEGQLCGGSQTCCAGSC